MTLVDFKSEHFKHSVSNGIAYISLNGAKRKNPLTFESYAALRAVSYTHLRAHET